MNAERTRPALTPPGRRRKPVNILDVVKRRWLLIALIGSALGAVVAPVFMLGGRSVYATSGLLAIDPGKEPTLTGRERETIPGNIGDYTRTLLNRMTAGDVLIDAMGRVPPDQWPSALDPARPPEANIGRLFKSIKAKEVPRTYLMSVEISGSSPRGLAPMLNAVLESFIAKLRRELEQQNARRLEYLRAERDQIVTRIAAERGRILDLAAAVPNKAFLHESYSVHLSKLEQIQRLYWEAEALRAQREGDYRRARADGDQLRRLSLQAYADERVADNFGINRIEQWTYEQLQSLRSTIDGLTTNNEDRTYVEMRMDAMNEYLRTYKAEVNDTTIRILREKREHDLDTDLITSSNALVGATFASETLATRLAEAKTEAGMISEAIFQAADLTFTVNQLRERLTALNNRIDDVEMESKAPLRVYIDRPAGDPRRPASNTAPQLAVLGLLVSFGLVAGLVIGFEFLDNRIRTPSDLAAVLGGPAAMPIPERRDGPFAEVLIDDPGGAAALAIRALAVKLNRERIHAAARVFSFVPAGPGVGNTSVALAVGHALGSLAPKVLVVSFGPEGFPAGAGPRIPSGGSVLLADPAKRASFTVHDERRGIDLLAIPPVVGGLGDRTGVVELLAGLRAAYDAVVIDLPPVVRDDLAQTLLPGVDAAVVVVREDTSMYHETRAAVDALAEAGVPAITAVLNASRRGPAGTGTARIEQLLHRVTVLHRRAAAEWTRRMNRSGKGDAS
ncbi:MAG TPA: hypothetical protein PKC67_10780 [Kiritimatiellia bacterium]|nr:hypothetical protein [Kiritimatiellia bacterium]HMP34823.1 hypothetical protein [Kiritimatiellia bacterium]